MINYCKCHCEAYNCTCNCEAYYRFFQLFVNISQINQLSVTFNIVPQNLMHAFENIDLVNEHLISKYAHLVLSYGHSISSTIVCNTTRLLSVSCHIH